MSRAKCNQGNGSNMGWYKHFGETGPTPFNHRQLVVT